MPAEKMISLTCPACGGKLGLTEGIDRFACAYCGVEHIVNRGEGIVTLGPVMQSLAKIESRAEDVFASLTEVQRTTDQSSIELKVARLRTDVKDLEEKRAKLTKDSSEALAVVLAIGLVTFAIGKMTDSNGWVVGAWIAFGLFALCLVGILIQSLTIDKEISRKRDEIQSTMRRLTQKNASKLKLTIFGSIPQPWPASQAAPLWYNYVVNVIRRYPP